MKIGEANFKTMMTQTAPDERAFRDEGLQRSLLWFAILLLNAVSIYTTARGAQLAWREGSIIATVVVPWAIALAVGVMLIVLTVEAGFHNFGLRSHYVLGSYLLLASVSVFFNFNFIYSSMTAAQEERASFEALSALRTSIVAQSKSYLLNTYKVNDLRSQLARVQAEMEVERIRPDRPGKGQLWIALMAKAQTLNADLNEAQARLSAEVSYIDSMGTRSTTSLPRNASYDDLHQKTEQLRVGVNILTEEIRSRYSFEPRISPVQEELLLGRDRRDLEYTINVIVNGINNLIDHGWQPSSSPKLLLALVLSLIIDVPIFFAVFFIGQHTPPTHKPSANASATVQDSARAPRQIWEERHEMWDDDPRSRSRENL